jgi:hypothetical protein
MDVLFCRKPIHRACRNQAFYTQQLIFAGYEMMPDLSAWLDDSQPPSLHIGR